MSDIIKTTPEIKNLAEEYVEEWFRNWHQIMPEESNYIDIHKYNEIQELATLIFEDKLREANDSLKNHKLSIVILRGPEYEFKYTKFRILRWLKKKLSKSKPPEIMRFVLDDKYYNGINMDSILYFPIEHLTDIVLVPRVLSLVKKLKETK